MTDLDIAMGIVVQAVVDVTRAFAALDTGLEMLVRASHDRELAIIQCAQANPHATAEAIIGAVDRHLSKDIGTVQ
jgi:hypothetical protein